MNTSTASVTVASSDAANLLASYLISRSTPFEIEPLPDGKWFFGVKEEILAAVETFLAVSIPVKR